MESGSQSGVGKQDEVGQDATKAIETAHHAFFQDLNAVCSGSQDRLNEAFKKYATPPAEPPTPATMQALNEEYFKAVQAACFGSEVVTQMATAFEKYKAAAMQALSATVDPAGLAVLSQSMYVVAMYAGQIPFSKGTP